jgi:bacteriorhodopsin
MTEIQSNIFVFVVLPLIFIAIWSFAFVHNRRIKARIKEIEGPSGHLESMEAGITAAMNDRSRKGVR